MSEIRDIIYSAPSLTSPPSARRSCWTQTLIWSAINSPCEKQQKVYAGLQFSVLTEWKSFLSAQHSVPAIPGPARHKQTVTHAAAATATAARWSR